MQHLNLKNKIIDLGYHFEELAPGIFLIENFYGQKDYDEVWATINTASQKDWEKSYRDSQIELAKRLHNREDLDNLIEEGIMEYTYAWSDKSIKLPTKYAKKISKKLFPIFSFNSDLFVAGFENIQRQYEGAPLIEHVDSHGDPYIAYATIAYINDDYTDGEVFFPNFDLEFRPKAGSLLIFPSQDQYLHGVKSPGAGPERYVLPGFVYSSEPSDKTP